MYQLSFNLFEDEIHQEAIAILDAGGRDIPTPLPPEPFDLLSYDVYLVMFSGGKDSVASFLDLLEKGVPIEKIELWHHDVDGREGSTLMDWACTPAYCAAFTKAFGVPFYRSWRMGGIEREMLRDNTATAPVRFEMPGGEIGQAGGESNKLGTRRRFPQQSGNLSTRWCSAAVKVDVGASAIRNQPRFEGKRTLVVTGERAEESTCRANYETFEPDRADRRHSEKLQRHVDHYRPVHGWSEAEVWAMLERWRINPHPAYRLGWGRVSCAACIFLSENGWASLRSVNSAQFNQIACYESEFGCTISRKRITVVQAADKGTSYPSITPELVSLATSHEWNEPIILPADVVWTLPAGAFGDSAGPT